MGCRIEPPFMFNCIKHHIGYIVSKIEDIRSQKELNTFPPELLKIGNSQMDIYTGNLSPEAIISILKGYLSKEHALKKNAYNSWLKAYGRDYRLVTISDNSRWALRLGTENDRFIHVHPAKHAPKSLRVKALTLKTAILVVAAAKIYNANPVSISFINQIRTRYLNTSPLKTVDTREGLGKIIILMRNALINTSKS